MSMSAFQPPVGAQVQQDSAAPHHYDMVGQVTGQYCRRNIHLLTGFFGTWLLAVKFRQRGARGFFGKERYGFARIREGWTQVTYAFPSPG